MMTPEIHISCTAALGQGGLGYHMQFVAESAHRATGEIPHLYSTDNLVRQERMHCMKPEPNWMFLCHYSPVRWLPGLQNFVRQSYFDHAVAGHIPHQPVAFHAFPGAAEMSFQRVLRRKGLTVLEAATVHVKDLVHAVKREHAEYKMRGSPYLTLWENKVLREYELASYITVSSQLQMHSFLRNGYPAEKLLLAPLGVDCDRFHPLPDQPSLRERHAGEKFRVVQVGQVSLLKGFQYALKALERLNDPDVELVLFGGVGWRAIRVYLDRFRRTGFAVQTLSGDPLPILRTAHVCIHPSITDGFGLAPLEAMATAVPAIVTEQTGMKDVLSDGVNGYIIPPRNAEELALKIYELKSNDALRIKMARAARAAALTFDAKTCTHRYARVMQPLWSGL